MANLTYSIIVPIFNEAGNIEPLYREIAAAMGQLHQPYEVIFIDDGSTDGSFDEMRRLPAVRIIRFRKNFGQTAALDAGFKHARGRVFITMDGDGQNNPVDIPRLLAVLDQGYDFVSGWRTKRRDSYGKRFLSHGARWLRRFLVADRIHDAGCTLKVYRRECFEELDLFGEIHRFIPAMLVWKGFRVGELPVDHRPRRHGQTKYNWRRVIKGLVDMMSVWFWRKYSGRPLHLFGSLGIILGTIGALLGLTLAILRISGLLSLQNSIWPLVSVFLVLAGIQFFISGLLGDIAIKTYYRERRTVYSIRDIIEPPDDANG